MDKIIFIRHSGEEYSARALEFIDATGYNPLEALILIQRTCSKDGWVQGQMKKEDFWKGELEPIYHAVLDPNYPDHLYKGISVSTVEKLTKEYEADYRSRFTKQAEELEKTKHPKAAAQVRERGEFFLNTIFKNFESWKKKNEAR